MGGLTAKRNGLSITAPDSVKVGGLTFDIERADDITESGIMRYIACKILLNGELENNPAELLDTFLHECLHVMDYAGKLKLGEARIHRLAFMLTAFLLDNDLVPERMKNPAQSGAE